MSAGALRRGLSARPLGATTTLHARLYIMAAGQLWAVRAFLAAGRPSAAGEAWKVARGLRDEARALRRIEVRP